MSVLAHRSTQPPSRHSCMRVPTVLEPESDVLMVSIPGNIQLPHMHAIQSCYNKIHPGATFGFPTEVNSSTWTDVIIMGSDGVHTRQLHVTGDRGHNDVALTFRLQYSWNPHAGTSAGWLG